MPSFLKEPLGVLARSSGFRWLFAARVGSELGGWLAFVAMAVAVYDLTGSATWVSALLLAQFIPAVAFGLTLGPLVDRWPRRRMMVICDAISAAAFFAMPFADARGIIALAFVAGVTNWFFRAAVFAGVANLVDREDLPQANGLLSLSENIAVLAGPVLSGLLLVFFSPAPIYVINAVTFVLSALFVLRISAERLQTTQALSQGHWHDLAEGFRLVLRERALLCVLLAWATATISFALVNVSEVVMAKVDLDAGNFGYGVLLTTAGVGLTLGSLLAGSVIKKAGLAMAYTTAFLTMALAVGFGAISPMLWIVAALMVVNGVGNSIGLVSNITYIQMTTPDHLRGRVFTSIPAVSNLTLGAGMVAAGPLTDAAGARGTWAVAAALLLVAGLIAYLMAPRERVAEVAVQPSET